MQQANGGYRSRRRERRFSRPLTIMTWAVMVLIFMPASARSAYAEEAGKQRPNILILFVDQLRWSEVGCYGNQVIQTPNLDKLAAEGLRFTHAYTNFPSCSPARSTLYSGRYARSNGVYANQQGNSGLQRPTNSDTTLAEALAAAGYATALIGKWHLTPNPQALGFQQSLVARQGEGYFKTGWRVNDHQAGDYTYQGYTLEHEAELAEKFIHEQGRAHRDRPFLLCLTPSPPHMPLIDLPEKYKAMYEPAKMPLRKNVWKDGQLAFNEDWFKIYLWDGRYYRDRSAFKEQLPVGITLRDLYALYYGQTTAADDWAGRVLQALKEAGLAENTIVLFSADHGDLLGSHQLFNKNEHYDEASRIPFLMRWPGRIKPRVIDQQVISLVDVMPTLLDLCGVKTPPSVQGTSFAPVAAGRAETVGENAAYIETTKNEGVRTRQYVYYCNRKTQGGEHLFDVEKDPYEMNDVVGDPAYRGVLEKLRARSRAWRERTPSVQPKKAETTRR